jgi:serine/threonine-protein kinase HipA
MGRLAHTAGIDAVSSRVLIMPSGHEVLMSLRYDQAEGVKESPRQFKMMRQYHRIAMKAILAQDPDMRGRDLASATCEDIANAIRKYSDDPVADIDELYRRVIFHIGVSNTDNNLNNTEMYLNDMGHWRLSPSYDVVPNPAGGDFVVPITDSLQNTTQTRLNLTVLGAIADRFQLDREKAYRLAQPVLEQIAKAEDHLRQANVQDRDVELVQSAFRRREAAELLHTLQRHQVTSAVPQPEPPSSGPGFEP